MHQYPANWESICREVRSRDNNRCVMCGRNDMALHVDHIRPLSKGGHSVSSNLRTLCTICHVKRHPHMVRDPYWQQTVYTQLSHEAERRSWDRYWKRRVLLHKAFWGGVRSVDYVLGFKRKSRSYKIQRRWLYKKRRR